MARRARRRGSVLIRAFITVAGIAVVGGVVLAATIPMGGRSGDPALSADRAVAQTMDFAITTAAVGQLEAKSQIELSSGLAVDSTILSIVPEGSFVRQGDLLVELNAEDIEDRLRQERLQVKSAQTDLDAAEKAYLIQISENDSRLRAAQLDLDLAELELEQWRKGEVVQRRRQLELDIEKAQKDFERQSRIVDANEELLAKEFLSLDRYQLDKISLLQARATLDKVTLEKETYEKYQYPRDEKTKVSNVEEARASLERVEKRNEIELAGKNADRENRREQLSIREERLANLEDQFKKAKIYAPSDGLVVYATSSGRGFGDSDGTLQPGRRVRPREPLILLPDTSAMIAAVRVHESLAGRVRRGMPALVRVDAAAGKVFPGVVDSISVLAENYGWRDPNRRDYTVRVALAATSNAEEEGLKPSMGCEATITLGDVRGVLAVPIQAVFTDGPVRFVYRPVGPRFERVPVKVGRKSDLFAEVLVGLRAGERVLIREPKPNEIIQAEWDPEAIIAVGLEIGEDGKPVTPEQPGNGARPAEVPQRPPADAQTASNGQGGSPQRPAGDRTNGAGQRGERRAPSGGG